MVDDLFDWREQSMNQERNFNFEFSTLEKAFEYAEGFEEKAVVTKDYHMFYVVDCDHVKDYEKIGFHHV